MTRIKFSYMDCWSDEASICFLSAIFLIVTLMSAAALQSVSVSMRDTGINGNDLEPDVSGVANVDSENEK